MQFAVEMKRSPFYTAFRADKTQFTIRTNEVAIMIEGLVSAQAFVNFSDNGLTESEKDLLQGAIDDQMATLPDW